MKYKNRRKVIGGVGEEGNYQVGTIGKFCKLTIHPFFPSFSNLPCVRVANQKSDLQKYIMILNDWAIKGQMKLNINLCRIIQVLEKIYQL